MRILGLDLGTKTIGVAVSDSLLITAQAVEVIRRTSLKADLTRLKEIIAEYEVTRIVLGMPRRTDGSYGPEAEAVQKFAEILRREIGLPVEFWDERFSTVTAQRILLEGDVSRAKRRKVVDKVAASVILQAYLEHSGGTIKRD